MLVALGVAGCGGSSSNSKPNPSQQVRTVVNDFTVELGQNQIRQACQLTTGKLGSTCTALTGGPTATECQGAGNSQAGQACATYQQIKGALSKFTSLTISKVVVIGRQATVAFNASPEVMTLSEQKSRWLISSA